MTDHTPDLFPSSAASPRARHIYSVIELTGRIQELLEGTFGTVWVEGEISNCRPSGAGHVYFSLKERENNQEAVLSAVLFSRASKDVKFKLEDGLKVICLGSIDVYAPRGQYQLIVEKVEPKGIGSLQLALEQLKKKLESEGLFAPEHKKPIPYLPAHIGVVTSLTGAAIKDILKVLDRRFRDTHIVISPVRVQGEGAKEDIAQAIADFNDFNAAVPAAHRIEVLIVGRGGGSIEDLWAFNEEVVARAIYHSRIPVISAVGHERDVTISDLVADLRAATPSVAAELVIPRKEDLREKLESYTQSLTQDVRDMLEESRDSLADCMHRLRMSAEHAWELDANRVSATIKKLMLLNPAVRIPEYLVKIRDYARQIHVRASHLVSLKESQLSGTAEKLSSLNPLNILARGYSVTFTVPGGGVIKDAGAVKTGDRIRSKLHRGEIVSTVNHITGEN